MAREFSLEEALGQGAKNPTEFSLDEAIGKAPIARAPTEEDTERTIGESVKDVGAGLVGGLGSLVQLPGQVYGLATGDFSKTGLLGAGERLSEYGEEMKSEGLKAREAQRAKVVEEASKEGQFAAFKAALGETITDPGLLAGFLAEQAPQIIPMILAGGGAGYIAKRGVMSAAAARGAAVEAAERLAQKKALQAGTTAAVQTGAVMQGADIGAGSYDDIVAGLIEQGATPEQAAEEAINKARLAGASAYALSVIANRYLPGGKALEEILAGKKLAGSRIAGAAVTGLKEIPSENIEEVGGKIAQNIAARSAGLDRELLEGTGETAAMATIGAAGIGGAAGAISARPQAAEPKPDEFDKELDKFRKELGPEGDAPAQAEEEIDTAIDEEVAEEAPVAKPPVQFPGGFTATERELGRQEVPKAFGIFQEGSKTPLTTVSTQEEADRKIESLSKIRQEEQERLNKESEKINNGILADRRKLEVMEATGQTNTDQYVQAKAELSQKEQDAAEQRTQINNSIVSYGAPLVAVPIGKRTAIQSEVVVNRGDEVIGTFPSLEAAEASLRRIEPETFKQADTQARRQQFDEILKPAFAKFKLGDVGLNIVEAIKTDDGQSADGSYARNLIQVAMDAENPLKIMRHESMHALKELGFFTPQQWRALTEQANKTWVKQYLQSEMAEIEVDGQTQQVTRLEAYKRMGLSKQAIIEEAIADAFGSYARGATPPPGLIASLYKKLQNFFANFGQALRGAGFESAEDIFQRIERGDLKSKAPKKEAKPVVKAKEAEKAPETKKAEAPEAEVRAAQEKAKKEKYSLAGTGVPMSTRNLMEQQTPIAQQDLGLNTEAGRSGTNNVRDIAKALNRQTLDQLGAMKRNKLTQDDSTMISEAIADEVSYQLQTSSKTGTGLGWYSHNYPNAVKRLGKRFPELSTSKYARSVFSALVAVTSNGERVTKNIDNAIKLYADLRKGKRLVVMGNRRATALENNLQVIQDLMAEHGENFEKVLLKEITVSEMNARLRKMGKKADGSYLANTVVPAAAVYFGPKLGAFYANLSGSEGYLTMDLWWTRSINRMRGLLIPKATSASISKFRDMMDSPDATRDEVVAATIPLRNKYEEYGWNSELEHLAGAKEPSTKAAKPAWFEKAEAAAGDAYEQLLFEHNLEKMANTIYKNEFEMLEEAPFTATDRKFMYDAARKAQTLLRKNGVDLSLADIQAALWYYEKRLYAKLSGRKADDIGYEEAIIAQANQGSGRARPSVVFDKRTDRGDDSRGEVSGAEAVRGEPTRGAKLSLKKGVVAEVAPNPDHISAEKWREMTPTERLGATRSVANKVMSSVFSELGLRGYSYSFSTGKYEGEVNPNIIVEAPESATEQELEELGRVLGYVLDQKAMVVFDEYNKTSGSQAGFVKVRIPKEMTQEQMDELRGHIAMVVPQADGDTLRDGELVYGNFSAYNDNVDTLSDDQYHDAIIKAIESFPYDGDIMVSDPETFHSSFIWPETRSDYLKETRYGDSGEIQGEAGADVRGQGSRRLQAISEEGIALRDRWIDGRGAARLGGRERGNAVDFGQPTAEYGTPRQGSVSATGIHFSKQQRPEIRSNFYGTGLRGLERERLAEKENADIRDRIYFYVDNGKGVTPESGVGGIPHVIKLNNLYDTSADPLQIVKNIRGESSADRASKRERAIKKAGFDGYLVKDPIASQDYALLIGKHAVKTGKYSLRAPTTPAFKQWFGRSEITNKDGSPKVMYHGLAKDTTDFTRKTARGAPIFLTDDPKFAGRFAADSYESVARNPQQYLSKQQIDDGVKRAIAAIRKDYGKDTLGKEMIESLKTGNLNDATPEAKEYIQKEFISLLPTGPHIMPMYVRAENPFDFDNSSHVRRIREELDVDDDTIRSIRDGNWEEIEGSGIQEAIQMAGFDSFYVKEHGRKNIAVYEPNQVKSATGNSGEYSRVNNDVSYSLKSVRFPSVKAVKEAVAETEVPTTQEFKRFIAGNQWVDEDDKAAVFYHATANEFLEFTPFGKTQAIYLSRTPEEAEVFGRMAEDRRREEIYKLLDKDQKLKLFQRVLGEQVEKGGVTEDQVSDFIRDAKRKAPEYGKFGDFDKPIKDALLDLSPTRMSIMPLYARAETPFDFRNPDHVARVVEATRRPDAKISEVNRETAEQLSAPTEYPDNWYKGLPGNLKQGFTKTIEQPPVQDALRRLKFDGYISRQNRTSPLSYAVYNPTQLKSVTDNSGEFDRAVKNISYSLRSFRKEELPQKARNYTLPANTLLYHGAYKERADRIDEMGGILLSRPPMRVSGGAINEGGLIFFGDEDSAQQFAESRADPRAVEDARQAGIERLPGKVFETATDRSYELINRKYEMKAREAKALTEALGLPDYKALRAGDSLETAAYRALAYDNSKIDRYEVTKRTGQGKEKISAPWPVIFRTLGVDGFYDSFGVALTANNGIKLVGKDGKLEKYSLPSIPAAAQGRIEDTTTVRQEVNFARRIIEAISPKSVGHFRAQAINRYNQLSVYDKKLAEKMGGAVLLADQSAESAALMSDLASGVAASAMGLDNRTGGIPVLRNGVTTIDSSVKGLIASLAPLAAYGDPAIYRRYQYWAMVKRGVRLNAQGKDVGITAADVAFAKMLGQKHPEFASVQKDLIKFNNGLVKYMVDTGVLSKGRAAEYTKYADYVPFYRQMDGETTVGPNLFQSISGVRPPKKLKGGDAPLADFLETMVRNTTSAIQAGAKNYAAQRAINVVQQVKAPGMGATRLDYVSTKPDVVNVLEDGKVVSYQTPDELLLYAVKSLNLSDIPGMAFFSMPADLLRNLVTKDPGFMMANLLRDSLSAYVTSGQSMTPVLDTVISFGKSLANKSPATRALLDAGVISGYDAGDIESSGKNLEEDLAKKAGKRRDAVVLRPFKSLWAGLEAGTTASDAATRAVIYERVLAETGNEAEAIFRALEVMNFHRKGGNTLVRVLTAAVPFFNARLQGLDLFYRASSGNMNSSDAAAIKRKFWARGTAMMAISAAYYFAVADDEEYKKQEQETRDNNWLIPYFGMKIPIPFEVGVLFKTIPERIAALASGRDTAEDFGDSLFRSFFATFGFNPIPQTIKPLVEVYFDKNMFTMRPILSEGLKDVEAKFQVGPSTSSFIGGIAGALGISPIKADHVIKGYTGTMGMYAVDTIDMVINQFTDSPKATKRFEQMPVIKRFALDPEARGNVTEYYKLKDAVDGVVRTMNFLEKQQESGEYVEYLKENQGTLAFKDYVRDVEKTMKELRDARSAIRVSTMSGDEKREALVEIGRAESEITAEMQRIKQAIASMQ
jgi:hypothetical protein